MSNTTENKELEELVRRQLELIGEDPKREGLVRTPARVAKAVQELGVDPEKVTTDLPGADEPERLATYYIDEVRAQ